MRKPLVAAVVALLSGVACAPEPVTPAQPVAAAAPGNGPPSTAVGRIPQLKIRLVDGSDYDLAAQRGRWVVVNFWATWCGPCLKEMPELGELAKQRKDVAVIGLAYEDIEPQAMREFLTRRPPGYPVAILDTLNPPADFEAPRGLPMTVLIRPDGHVAKTILGPVTRASLEAEIGPPALR